MFKLQKEKAMASLIESVATKQLGSVDSEPEKKTPDRPSAPSSTSSLGSSTQRSTKSWRTTYNSGMFYTNILYRNRQHKNVFTRSIEKSKEEIDRRKLQTTCLHRNIRLRVNETNNETYATCSDCKPLLRLDPLRLEKELKQAQMAKQQDQDFIHRKNSSSSSSSSSSIGKNTSSSSKMNHIQERAEARRINAEEKPNNNSEIHANRLLALGIRIDALIDFAHDHNCWDWTTLEVVNKIIKPATKDNKRCRYGDLPESKECFGPATVFMSHCWGARFGDLIGAACHGARKDRIVWIDIFAVRQWSGNTADLDFRRVLGKCKAVIVSMSPMSECPELKTLMHEKKDRDRLMNSEIGKRMRKSFPIFRLWCVVEIAAAVKKNIPVVIKVGKAKETTVENKQNKSENELNKSAIEYQYDEECIEMSRYNLQYFVDVETSECTCPIDRKREMDNIRSVKGEMNKINKHVVGVLVAGIYDNRKQVTYMEGERFRTETIKEGNMSSMQVDADVCGEPESLRHLIRTEMRALSSSKCNWNFASQVLQSVGATGRIKALSVLLERWSHDPKHLLVRLINMSKVLWLASSGGHSEVVEMILKIDESNDEVPVVTLRDYHVGLCGEPVASNCIDKNVVHHNMTPLFVACEKGHGKTVKVLLATKGVDVNSQNHDFFGKSPLWIAAFFGHNDSITHLLNHSKINIDSTNPAAWFWTPLLIARWNGHMESASIIREKGGSYCHQMMIGMMLVPLLFLYMVLTTISQSLAALSFVLVVYAVCNARLLLNGFKLFQWKRIRNKKLTIGILLSVGSVLIGVLFGAVCFVFNVGKFILY